MKTTDLLQLVSGGGDRKDPVPYGERSGWGKKHRNKCEFSIYPNWLQQFTDIYIYAVFTIK